MSPAVHRDKIVSPLGNWRPATASYLNHIQELDQCSFFCMVRKCLDTGKTHATFEGPVSNNENVKAKIKTVRQTGADVQTDNAITICPQSQFKEAYKTLYIGVTSTRYFVHVHTYAGELVDGSI